MELGFIIWLIIAHWIADFVFQDEQWALNKSKSIIALLKHTSMYTIVMGFLFFPILQEYILPFLAINFAMHTATDYVTSKIVASRFQQKYLGGRIPNLGAFSVIGFDQVLHYIVLFSTLQYYL